MFTKEFVFKVIDELFQYGKLYEESKQVYKYLSWWINKLTLI